MTSGVFLLRKLKCYERNSADTAGLRHKKSMNQNQTESKPEDVEKPREKRLDETICSALEDALSVVLPHHALACVSRLNLHDKPWSFDVANNGKPLITPESCKCSDAVKYLREALPANHPKGFSQNADGDGRRKPAPPAH